MVLEKTLESTLDFKEIQPVHPKEKISPEYSLEEIMLELIGHLMPTADLLEKTDARKDCRQEKKGAAEDKMVGWHHQLNGCEFE